MMQIDGKGIDDLLLNMVLETKNLNIKKNDTFSHLLPCE